MSFSDFNSLKTSTNTELQRLKNEEPERTSNKAVTFSFFGKETQSVDLGKTTNWGLRKPYNSITGAFPKFLEGLGATGAANYLRRVRSSTGVGGGSHVVTNEVDK